MSPCPAPADLERLLSNELNAAEEAALGAHLTGCAACERWLEDHTALPRSGLWTYVGRQRSDEEARIERLLLGACRSPMDAASALPMSEKTQKPPLPLPCIPGYEVVAELGRGGMGVVYKARQLGPNRWVALKVIRADRLLHEEARARFQREVEAASRMQHPGVVPLFASGEQGGQPFVVFEYVAGGSLADCCRGTPQSAPIAARLIEQAARAVEAIHRHGIVHRDLKPANILLAPGEGPIGPMGPVSPIGPGNHSLLTTHQPKITDFGLARWLSDEGSLTDPRDILGTPSYMAPEQTRGGRAEIGPTTDVYALGAILYELLTGRPPFRSTQTMATLLQIAFEEPVPPSRLVASVPVDLDTICLKCLQKEPTRRYTSAAALAEDLTCFLENRPIAARPIGWSGRVVRWCRRNPQAAALAGTLTVVLLGLAIGGPFLAYYQYQLRQQAENNATRADEQRLMAEANERTARTQQARADRNAALAFRAVQETGGRIADDVGLQQADFFPLRRELVASVLRFHEELIRQEGASVQLREAQARAHGNAAYLRSRMGEIDKAQEHLRQALALWPGLLGEQPHNATFRQEQIDALSLAARLHFEHGEIREAETGVRQTLSLNQQLLAEAPGDSERRLRVARSFEALGAILSRQNKPEEAIGSFRQQLAMIEAVAQDTPQATTTGPELAQACLHLGRALGHLPSKLAEAELFLRRAIETLERKGGQLQLPADVRDLLPRCYGQLALVLWDRRAWPEAEALFQRALKQQRELSARYPGLLASRVELGGQCCNLGLLLDERGRHPEALAAYEEGLLHLREVVRRDPKLAIAREYLVNTLHGKATTLAKVARHAEAVAAWDEALPFIPAANVAQRRILLLGRAKSLAVLGRTKPANQGSSGL